MTREYFLILTLVAVSAVAAETAKACSCMAPASPQEELRRSSMVFAGRVISVNRIESDGGYAYNQVRFDVLRTFGEGRPGARLTVRTATNSAACGYNFSKGGHYLVYTYENDGVQHTSICSRTARFRDATEDLAAFNATELLDVADKSPRCGGPTGTAAVQSALLVVAFVLLRRRDLVT